MPTPADTSRFTVKPHEGRPGATGAPVTIFRVYDNQKHSYPRLIAGRVVQDHYSARDHAQRVADELNEENQ
jgi:hypothetical protein